MVFPTGKRGFLRKALFDVLSMLNSNLMPTWFHFASQNRSKIHENVDPKRVPIMHPFSLRFWIPKTSFLGPNLEPSWPSVSLQDGPRSLPDPPKRPPRSNLEPSWPSVSLQDGPRSLPAPPKRAPRSTLEPSWLSNSFQDGPRSLRDPPRGLPGPSGGPFLIDFW